MAKKTQSLTPLTREKLLKLADERDRIIASLLESHRVALAEVKRIEGQLGRLGYRVEREKHLGRAMRGIVR